MQEQYHKTCPQCGKETALQTKVCTNCGYHYAPVVAPVNTNLNPTLVITVALVGVVLFLIGLLTSTRLSTGKQASFLSQNAPEPDTAVSIAEKEPQAAASPKDDLDIAIPDVIGVKESQAREVTTAKGLDIDVTVSSSSTVLRGVLSVSLPSRAR